jgi:hypothetical protein
VPHSSGAVYGAMQMTFHLSLDEKQVGGTHYENMEVQPWNVLEAILTREEFIGFIKGNIVKYAMRQGKKPDSDDAGKAKHYMEKLMEIEEWK